jgi:hypothetical protein
VAREEEEEVRLPVVILPLAALRERAPPLPLLPTLVETKDCRSPVVMLPFAVVREIAPELPPPPRPPKELERRVPVLMLLLAVREIAPPSPALDVESNVPALVSIVPAVVLMVILPPLTRFPEAVMALVIMSPAAEKAISPPFPAKVELEFTVPARVSIEPVVLLRVIFPLPKLPEEVMLPVVMLLLAEKAIAPPFPDPELESSWIVLIMLPPLLFRVIVPALPVEPPVVLVRTLPVLISPWAFKTIVPPLAPKACTPKVAAVVSMLPWLLVMVILPAVPTEFERAVTSAVVILPLAVRVISPPLPSP